MNLNETLAGGFEYLIEHVRNGVVIDSEVVKNLLPTEAINHLMNVGLKAATPTANWYLAPFEGNYTPQATDTAATLPALCTESTAYAEATRVVWVAGTVVSGAVSNTASKAEFTANATKTLYGGFMTSNATKSSTSGVLASVVRFSAPKAVESGDVLRVTAGFTLTSL